jgi:hypothetical protein
MHPSHLKVFTIGGSELNIVVNKTIKTSWVDYEVVMNQLWLVNIPIG